MGMNVIGMLNAYSEYAFNSQAQNSLLPVIQAQGKKAQREADVAESCAPYEMANRVIGAACTTFGAISQAGVGIDEDAKKAFLVGKLPKDLKACVI